MRRDPYERADTDSNYSTFLSLWDRLFASRSPNPREPQMKIGVEGRQDAPIQRLLLLPFRRDPQ